jgi:membrane fusion protein, copper/silver efflux system
VENVTTGDFVRKGQPLLQLYSPDINSAAAQLIASPGFEGSRRRLKNLNVGDDAIAEMERTHKVPLAITWYAPRDGFVLERNAVDGMKAAAGDVLFRIADLSVMWVLADVPEYDLGSVKPGQNVVIKVRSLPGRTLTGRVSLVYPRVDKQARTTKVRIEIANPDGVLRPDMYADVEIATGTGNPVLAVPDSAVIDTGTRKIVILDLGEGRFKPQEVVTGEQGGGFTEIRSGIAAGARVVVAANFLIDAESNLKAALNGMAAAEPAQ